MSTNSHVRKRGENSYEIRITKGKDADGNRIFDYITFRGTEEEAEAERIRRLNDLNQGAYIEHSKITVSEFFEQWLATYAEGNVQQITLEGYKSIIENHFKPSFGGLPLQKLLPFVIQNHYAKLMKEGGRKDGRKGALSRTTVMHQHRLLSEALAMAVRWQLLPRNPCDAVTPPRLDPREVQAIDETATAWLIEAAQGTRLYLPIFMATSAGMRRGEILAAVWSNVDERSGTLRIDRALSETKEKGVFFKKPKGRRTRTVALPPLLLEAMKSHLEEQNKRREMLGSGYSDNDLICCQPDGSVWAPSAFTSAYRALLKRRGLDGPNFHGLRHAHASQSLADGVDIKTVSSRLGHSKASFTLAQYCHLMPGQDQEAAARTDARLRRALEQVRNPQRV